MCSATDKPFFRADHVGSLLRPATLLDARSAFESGALSRDALREAENAAIREVAAYQEQLGLQAITDGEFRRKNWWVDFIGSLRGVELHDGDDKAAFVGAPGSNWRYVPMDVKTVAPLGVDTSVLTGEFEFLKACTGRVAKITLPSPTRMHFHGGRRNVSTDAYPDIEEFFAAVAGIYRSQIAALEAAGCRYLQIDDPLLTYFCSDRLKGRALEQGDDPDRLLARYVRLFNECTSARRPDTQLAVHLCRGNSRSSWISEGGYEKIADAVFPELKADAFFLEYDDPRSGGFEPLAAVPRGTKVVLGLITTKHGQLEDKDDLKRRLDAAAKYVRMEDLAISPQCGFASVVEGNVVTPDDQSRKLELAVGVARDVWGHV